ncbi:hypothetical protein XA39_12040 [Acinetobacter tandoii]|uniref:hypothetical protein n=1 Tax=Acinetobacter tandoii TaxID=202954 RepID=UPI000C209B30|nr:hypothetical protein [Acinetobacter tandoii]PJG42625.1 hypothetical protein XA39_12040 [Acinetobacter tandoii]
MTIPLEYQYDSNFMFNINARIWHPHHYLETWIVLTEPTLKSYEGTLQACDYHLIDFKQILERIYNFYLPDLRVLSTKIFFVDRDENEYIIEIQYSGQGIFNTQSINILNFRLELADFQDHRICKVRELLNNMVA